MSGYGNHAFLGYRLSHLEKTILNLETCIKNYEAWPENYEQIKSVENLKECRRLIIAMI